MRDKAIKVNNLVKKFNNFTAVDGINFSVNRGHLFAFLGPNGAGKSTTINMICTLLKKTSGDISVCGFDIQKEEKVRECLGVVFQENILDDLLTVKENLFIRGSLYGKTAEELKERLQFVSNVMGINDILNRRFGLLSGGQKRRAEIARALMSNPEILVLDEPTTGLDPQTRLNVWDIISRLQKELNMTVFFTTHYMEEAANADIVAIIDRGKIVASGTPNELKMKHACDLLKIIPIESAQIEEIFEENKIVFEVYVDMFLIRVKNSLEAYEILKKIENKFKAFEVVRGTMDDVFVNITGRKIREDA